MRVSKSSDPERLNNICVAKRVKHCCPLRRTAYYKFAPSTLTTNPQHGTQSHGIKKKNTELIVGLNYADLIHVQYRRPPLIIHMGDQYSDAQAIATSTPLQVAARLYRNNSSRTHWTAAHHHDAMPPQLKHTQT